jgi:hypothetical protein
MLKRWDRMPALSFRCLLDAARFVWGLARRLAAWRAARGRAAPEIPCTATHLSSSIPPPDISPPTTARIVGGRFSVNL